MTGKKTYIGYSVYAEMTEYGDLRLTTENGMPGDPSNVILLTPEVYDNLRHYMGDE